MRRGGEGEAGAETESPGNRNRANHKVGGNVCFKRRGAEKAVVKKKKVQSWRRKVETTEERNALHEADGDGSGAGFGRRLQEIGSKKKRLLGSKNAMLQDSPQDRGFTRLRLSEFVQISEFFQFYITDIVRHLSHFPKVSI